MQIFSRKNVSFATENLAPGNTNVPYGPFVPGLPFGLFSRLFVSNKVVWPFDHTLSFLECGRKVSFLNLICKKKLSYSKRQDISKIGILQFPRIWSFWKCLQLNFVFLIVSYLATLDFAKKKVRRGQNLHFKILYAEKHNCVTSREFLILYNRPS